MKKSALLIEHLFFRYDGHVVLDDVNVRIDEREFVGIFGPNGGGKTTLLKLVLGLLEIQEGKILLFGKSPQEMRHLIGYVPQSLQFDRDFPISVLEVVMMGSLRKLDVWGRYPKEIKQKALIALEQVNLASKAKASFGTLSGGQAQRALIARAIIDRPKLLILDEPTAHIDPEGQQSVLDMLFQLKESMTILMVTHDLQTIVDKAQRLLCVQRKVSSLKAKEVCEHFALGLYHTPLSPSEHFRL